MSFQKLLSERTWDLIFVGAMEISLGYTLYDCPAGIRPPIFYFHHGILFGEPLSELFLEAEKYIAIGSVERKYFLNMGITEDKIVTLGSIDRESFPDKECLYRLRASARDELGIPKDRPVIVYGLTLDIYLYQKRPCDELTALLMQAFRYVVEKFGCTEPYLFLKYHPSPRSDPYFSFSRQQMPLESFFDSLQPLGYRIHLIKELKPYLQAADCFIAHESATVMTAVEHGCPTVSLAFHDGKAQPLLGWDAYPHCKSHKLVSDNEAPESIARAIKEVLDCPKEIAYSETKAIWERLFGIGRTHSLVKLIELVDQYTSSGQGLSIRTSESARAGSTSS
jgi:hypothetical protein